MPVPGAVLIAFSPCVGSLRTISGGSDASLITTWITGASLCLQCLARRAGVTLSQVDAMIARIATTIALWVRPGRCDGCLAEKIVFRLDRISQRRHPDRPSQGTQVKEVWRFLEAHRGVMFCAHCLAAELGFSGRIDRAVMSAEGRGARRLYGRCATCGKERLLCGLG